MWNTFISLAHRAGFTRNEAAVVLFMCSAIIAGSLLSAFRDAPAPGTDFRTLLAEHDSLFAERASRPVKVEAPPAVEPGTDGGRTKSGSVAAKQSSSVVNINAAGTTELQTLPGVGEATAKKIVAWRTDHGRFKRVEDIMDVPSIGEKKFEKMRHRITVE